MVVGMYWPEILVMSAVRKQVTPSHIQDTVTLNVWCERLWVLSIYLLPTVDCYHPLQGFVTSDCIYLKIEDVLVSLLEYCASWLKDMIKLETAIMIVFCHFIHGHRHPFCELRQLYLIYTKVGWNCFKKKGEKKIPKHNLVVRITWLFSPTPPLHSCSPVKIHNSEHWCLFSMVNNYTLS
jgi:hypothetical protein